MAVSVSPSELGTEFNNFLFAPIGDDEKGMLVSVLSALARLNLDPWAEAADLARLPKETATRRLASLIAKLPQGALDHLDLSAASVRLIALLPRLTSFEVLPDQMSRRAGTAVTQRRPSAYVMAVVMIIVLGVQYLYSSNQTSTPLKQLRAHVHSVSPKLASRRNGP